MEEGSGLEESVKPKFMKAYVMKIKLKILGVQKTLKQASRNFGLFTFKRKKYCPLCVTMYNIVNLG
jgi:hypothetical protein